MNPPGAKAMRESVTYTAIVEEGVEKGIKKGRLQELRRMIKKLGRKALGPASKKAIARIAAIDDRRRLEGMLERLGDVRNWNELLGE
jgi:hypothetical protein